MRPRPFRLERFFAEHEFSVPHLLCASDCEPVRLNELLEGAGVLLLPGSLYPDADSFHARIGFGRRDFPAGLEALEGYLAKNYSRIQEGA